MSSLSKIVYPLLVFGGAIVVTKWLMKQVLLSGLVEVRSNHDQRIYYVAAGPHAQDAANALARVRHGLAQVFDAVSKETPQEKLLRDGIANLRSRYRTSNDINVYELDPHTNEGDIAFNQNKRDGIFLCIRKDLGTMEIANDETLMHIAVHELAHSMQRYSAPIQSNGETLHDAEFDAYEQLLKSKAIDLGLLGEFQMRETTHCGKIIS